MCVFVGPKPVGRVAYTRIFARFGTHEPRRWFRRPRQTQLLAYSMHLGLAAETVMVLPLPLAKGAGEEAVRFIDLSGYPTLFTELDRLVFPAPVIRGHDGAISGGLGTLAVHAVGSYEASFVPRRSEFSRLDPRFRMSPDVWNAMPDYADWGFAVFALKETREAEFHPMAFEFPTRFGDRLFFPTVHVHDGSFHPTAEFSHTLFLQTDGEVAPAWGRGHAVAGQLDVAAARGLLDARAPIFGRHLRGTLENKDTYVVLGGPGAVTTR